MKISNIFYALVLVFFFSGCKQKSSVNQIFSVLKNDKFKQPNRYLANSKLNYNLQIIENSVRIYRLADIQQGYDSCFIRIWYNYSFDRRNQIIELFKSEGKWNGFFYIIENVYNKEDSLIRIKKAFTIKNPKISWRQVEQSIIDNSITSLPDCDSILGYNFPSDGNSITVEVSTNEIYRLYTYSAPSGNKQFKQVKSLLNFLNIISEEFEFEPIRKL